MVKRTPEIAEKIEKDVRDLLIANPNLVSTKDSNNSDDDSEEFNEEEL